MVMPYASEFYTLTPLNPRALSAADLAAELNRRGAKATACAEVAEGVDAALNAAGKDGLVVIFGSLYLAGAVRTEFQARKKGEKAAQRKAGRAARQGLTAEQRAEKSARICRKLAALPELQNAGTVFSYLAMPDEVDLAAFDAWAAARGVRVAYPVCGKNGQMECYIPHSREEMLTDWYGITIPDPDKSELVRPGELDAVLVPMVAFDAANWRMGQGGGYYDRYLVRCPEAKHIAVAFAEQEVPHVVTDAYDMPMDMVITDK